MSWLAPPALLLVALIWGWTFVLVKEGASELGPLTFLAWRFALASSVLALLFHRRLHRLDGSSAAGGSGWPSSPSKCTKAVSSGRRWPRPAWGWSSSLGGSSIPGITRSYWWSRLGSSSC